MVGGWKAGDVDRGNRETCTPGQGPLDGLMRWNGMGVRIVHTQKKRGTRVTNKEWREFWKEMESQGMVGLVVPGKLQLVVNL